MLIIIIKLRFFHLFLKNLLLILSWVEGPFNWEDELLHVAVFVQQVWSFDLGLQGEHDQGIVGVEKWALFVKSTQIEVLYLRRLLPLKLISLLLTRGIERIIYFGLELIKTYGDVRICENPRDLVIDGRVLLFLL